MSLTVSVSVACEMSLIFWQLATFDPSALAVPCDSHGALRPRRDMLLKRAGFLRSRGPGALSIAKDCIPRDGSSPLAAGRVQPAPEIGEGMIAWGEGSVIGSEG
jgi:hypothetical protein